MKLDTILSLVTVPPDENSTPMPNPAIGSLYMLSKTVGGRDSTEIQKKLSFMLALFASKTGI